MSSALDLSYDAIYLAEFRDASPCDHWSSSAASPLVARCVVFVVIQRRFVSCSRIPCPRLGIHGAHYLVDRPELGNPISRQMTAPCGCTFSPVASLQHECHSLCERLGRHPRSLTLRSRVLLRTTTCNDSSPAVRMHRTSHSITCTCLLDSLRCLRSGMQFLSSSCYCRLILCL